MKYAEGHDPNCSSKAKRLYIRNYDPIRKKQVFTRWGATCLSCGMIFHIKPALVKGNKERDYMLNRGQRRRQDRIKDRIDKKIQNIEDPKIKSLVRKRYNYMLKTGK
jgi:hypothetical protein